MGIEPMSINCLLARLGTSQPVEAKYSLDELAAGFDLSTFSRTPPRFDMSDLENLNRKIYQVWPYAALQQKLKDLKAEGISEQIWNLIKGNISTLDELTQWQQVFFGDISNSADDKDYLAIALTLLPSEPWTIETWSSWTGAIKAKTGRKGRELFMPLRKALTGFDHGPEMKEVLPLLGEKLVRNRLGG
jgi:glutamyl-tRNA synthetase